MDEEETGAEAPPQPMSHGAHAADILGAAGMYFLFLGLIQLLYMELPNLPSTIRGGIFAALTFGGMMASGALLKPDKAGVPRGPTTARAIGGLSWALMLLGLMEFGRAYNLPPSYLSWLAIGASALYIGQALDSGMLCLAGAYLVHSTFSEWAGLQLGLVGGVLTNHIFLCMGVAALLVLVGLRRHERGARSAGLAMLGYGLCYLLFSFYILSRVGGGYHGLPDEAWIARGYLLVLLAVALLTLALARILRSGTLSALGALVLYFRILQAYIEWRGGAPETGIYITLGILLVFLAWSSEGGAPSMDPEPSPTLACRLGGLRVARALAALLLLGAVARGNCNLTGVTREVRVPLDCYVVPPLLLFQLDFGAVEYPMDAAPGEELDVWLQSWKVQENEPVLKFGRCMATRKGKGMPGALDAARTFKVPGRFIRCRLFDGLMIEAAIPMVRTIYEMPKGIANQPKAGRDLIFRQGRLGFPYPAGLKKSPPEEPPVSR